MAKATIASLEAALDAQRADFELRWATHDAEIDRLEQRINTLAERLDKASEAFRALRADVVSRQPSTPSTLSTPVGRMPVKPQPNLWFVALAQLRAELGLADGAFVARDDVMARMAELRAETQGSAAA